MDIHALRLAWFMSLPITILSHNEFSFVIVIIIIMHKLICFVVSFSNVTHRTFQCESLYPSAYLKTSTQREVSVTAWKVRFMIIIQCEIPGIVTRHVSISFRCGIEQIFERSCTKKRSSLSYSTPFEKYKNIYSLGHTFDRNNQL